MTHRLAGYRGLQLSRLEPLRMRGQWLGRLTGRNTPDALLMLDLDEYADHYAGRGTTYPDTPYPGSTAQIRTPDKNTAGFELVVPVQAVDRATNNVVIVPVGTEGMAQTATVRARHVNENAYAIDIDTDIDTHLSGTMQRLADNEPSRLLAKTDVDTWAAFKRYVFERPHRRHIYRGQRHPHRLRTTFHRSGRADMQRYLNEDLPDLHRHLSVQTQHAFNLSDADERGAFLNLVQHHGYPTPLLDWTYSPFVAAFFAYQNVTRDDVADGRDVRIFIFDKDEWRARNPQVLSATAFGPHVSVIEFAPTVDNQRHIPQQSISTITNVAEIESYLEFRQDTDNYSYLEAIDLPSHEREIAMRELSLMGITVGSLFPGLTGACEEMRERRFPW